jgi:hypothetical protein
MRRICRTKSADHGAEGALFEPEGYGTPQHAGTAFSLSGNDKDDACLLLLTLPEEIEQSAMRFEFGKAVEIDAGIDLDAALLYPADRMLVEC